MIDGELYRFQQDLKQGLTIEEALTKHNLTFQYVCDNLPRAYCSKSNKRGRNRSKSRQYILERRGKYSIRKYVDGKEQHFGTYYSLTDAIKVREHCKQYGWNKECIDKYCQILGVKRCTK